MKRVAIVVLLASAACCPKHYQPVIEYRDSLVVEYRDSLVYRDSIISVPIPLESDQAIVHIGDTSHRETSLAESDAWIGADGFLHHNLRNKRGNIDLHVPVPEHWIIDRAHEEKATTITNTVYVDKPLTKWQKFRLRAFWWLSAILLASIIWYFRKPILSLIRKIPI